jgi:hypothetical protein
MYIYIVYLSVTNICNPFIPKLNDFLEWVAMIIFSHKMDAPNCQTLYLGSFYY